MKNLFLISLFLAACSSHSNKSGAPGLSATLAPGDAAYPCGGTNCGAQIDVGYQVTVTNTGAGIQDLMVWISTPEKFPLASATVDGGFFHIGTGLLGFPIDWIGTNDEPVIANATFSGSINVYASSPTDLSGDLSFSTTAMITQYGKTVATSTSAETVAYLPQKIGPDPLSIASGAVDASYLYVSAQPQTGTYASIGGIYRVALADGTLTQIAKHAFGVADTLPFLLDGNTIYYVTHPTDATTWALMSIASDGSGVASTIPLPTGTLNVLAIQADATNLYMILEAMDQTDVIYRVGKSDASGTSSMSVGTLLADTMAVNSNSVIVMRTDKAQLWTFDKSTLAAMELTDMGGVGPTRGLACDDHECFFVDGMTHEIEQVDLTGQEVGVDPLLPSTTSIFYDGKMIYTGAGGLSRVGLHDPPQRLFAGNPTTVIAADAEYIYFTAPPYLWKLHK